MKSVDCMLGIKLQWEGDLISKGGGKQCFKKLFLFVLDVMQNNMVSTQILAKIYRSRLKDLNGCIEDLRRFSGNSAISRLGSRRLLIPEIQVVRRGIEPPTSCSASQELNHLATAAPMVKRI